MEILSEADHLFLVIIELNESKSWMVFQLLGREHFQIVLNYQVLKYQIQWK